MDPARQRYNDGFAAGLQARAGARNGSPVRIPVTAIPEPVAAPAPPATFEERVKRELHPLDSFPRLLECADANLPPDPTDRFRFEWFGLTYLAPAQDGFRLRLRVPGGILRTHQARELAELARQYASGCVAINAEAGLDLQTITVPDAPEALRRAEAAGLVFRGSGGDNVVAVLTNPLSGGAIRELIDATPYAARLEQCLWQGREFADLPRACTVSFSGGAAIDLEDELTGDIHFVAETRATGSDHAGAAVGFRVQVSGLGDLGTVLRPDQVVHAALELLRCYIRGADRSARQSALVYPFFATWGKDACMEALESSLGGKLPRSPSPAPAQSANNPSLEQAAWAELSSRGVAAWPRKQPGPWVVGVASPPGGWLSAKWEEIAHLADLFGSGRLRLTTRQAVLIPGVFKVETLEEKLGECRWLLPRATR